MKSFCTALLALVSISAAGVAQQPTRSAIDHGALAHQWLQTRGVEASEPAQVDFLRMLDERYVRAEIGAIDLRYPADMLVDKSRSTELRDVALAILDLQVAFVDWGGAGNDVEKALRKDFADLKKQLLAARPVSSSAAKPPKTLAEALGLAAGADEICARAGQSMRSGAAFAIRPSRENATLLLCGPTRRDFVGLVCAIGWLDEPARGLFWVDNVHLWTDLYWADLQAIALIYPPVGATPNDLSGGTPMNQREKSGLQEFVTQRAAHSLLWFWYGKRLDPVFESALTLELAIAACGQDNARTGFSTRGNELAEMSVFVPGGAPDGGVLPAQNADSPWRTSLGVDHFVKVLRTAQKSGAKETAAKKAGLDAFPIASGGSQRWLATAPFLGAAGRTKEPAPSAAVSEYMEFFRAYKCAFMFWLRTEGGKGRKDSEARFADVLRKLAGATEGEGTEAVLAEVYGVPWSAADGSADSLEKRFLAWLARQK